MGGVVWMGKSGFLGKNGSRWPFCCRRAAAGRDGHLHRHAVFETALLLGGGAIRAVGACLRIVRLLVVDGALGLGQAGKGA